MIPAMLSAIGFSLSEFVDSMVVSHLLNSDAFAVINLGTPIVFMVSTIYTITGLGIVDRNTVICFTDGFSFSPWQFFWLSYGIEGRV